MNDEVCGTFAKIDSASRRVNGNLAIENGALSFCARLNARSSTMWLTSSLFKSFFFGVALVENRNRSSVSEKTGSATMATPAVGGLRCLCSLRSTDNVEAEGKLTISFSMTKERPGAGVAIGNAP